VTLATFIKLSTWFYFSYFVLINLFYLALNFVAFFRVRKLMQWKDVHDLPQIYSGYELPISILAPAYNEAKTIVASVRSLQQIVYPDFEVIVINDGSKDETLEILKREFALVAFPETISEQLPSRPIRAMYRSSVFQNLRVIDKENGGKADSLNAGINAARCPLFCSIDADSILQRNSLHQVVQPFLEDPTTIVSGGTIRVVNGCQIREGNIVRVGLPKRLLPLMQVTEYLRAFLFGRLGWSPLNAVLIISGAFGLFRKSPVVEVGGYRTDTVGEDMELVMRLHRHMRLSRKPYRISFVPDPICWTEVPSHWSSLQSQRVRWQRGLCESLWMNRQLFFHPRAGSVGWLAFPFMVFFEVLEPLVQMSGYILTLFLYLNGSISIMAFVAFMLLVLGLGLLVSINAILLEEISFHVYPRLRHIIILFFSCVIESFGYRQINTWWRLKGLFYFLSRARKGWGDMKRKGFALILASLLSLSFSVHGAGFNREQIIKSARKAAEQKKYDAAEKLYQSIIKKSPDDLEVRVALANVHAWTGSYQQAEDELSDIIKLSPSYDEARISLARVYFWQGRDRESLKALALLHKKGLGDAKALEAKVIASLKSKQYWKAGLGYVFDHISFASDAHGTDAFLEYRKDKNWSARAAFEFLNKFNSKASGARVGGTYWIDDSTTVSADIFVAPSQQILPEQSYTLGLDRVFFKKVVPGLNYRFSQYFLNHTHAIGGHVQWYFYPRFNLFGSYTLTLSDLQNEIAKDNAFAFKLGFSPWDELQLSAGYARTSESFESGSRLNGAGGFNSNHFLSDVMFETHNIGLKLGLDYDNRDNGTAVTEVRSGLYYKWK